MEDNIIEVKNLVKKYKISERKHGILGYIKNIFHPKYKEFTAVNNISFNIKKGELVGYIGENGARKIYYDKDANWLAYSNIWKCFGKWNCAK